MVPMARVAGREIEIIGASMVESRRPGSGRAVTELATTHIRLRSPSPWAPEPVVMCVRDGRPAGTLGLARARARLAHGRGKGRSPPTCRGPNNWSHCVWPPRLARPRCRRYARNPAAPGSLRPPRPDCTRREACGSRGGGAGYRGHGQGLAARHYHGDALPLKGAARLLAWAFGRT